MDTDRAQLDTTLNQRRLQLGLRWVAVARRAGMTPQNLNRIRNGEISLSENAAAGIERALEYVAGTLASGNPVPSEDQPKPAATRRNEARRFIASLTREELVDAANLYAEAFGDEAAEAFLLRAAEIRRDANRAVDDEEADLG